MIISTANQKVKRILKLQKKAKARNEEHVYCEAKLQSDSCCRHGIGM